MSSRRQWTRMFMTKHTCNQDCKTPCPRNPNYTTPDPASAEERTSQDPKPRWSPTPEQIQILQSIFNSGIITPTREEIRNIRTQLQEYGEVGEANVFYWFQNRKSRNKNKKRHTTSSQTKTRTAAASPPTAGLPDVSPMFPAATEDPFPPSDPFLLAGQLEGFGFADQTPWTNVPFGGAAGGDSDQFLSTETMMGYQNDNMLSYNNVGDQLFNYSDGANNNFTVTPTDSVATATTCQAQGMWDESVPAMGSSTVFINDTAVEVGFERINVREVFGDDAVLIDSYGNPVVTDDWGFTLQPLQHGAFYNLVRWGTS